MENILKTYYYNEDLEENITTFYELDEEFYCLRATFKTATELLSTNSPLTPSQFFLPEGSFLDFIEELSPISHQQFRHYWTQSNQKYLTDWEILKKHYHINQRVIGNIVCFYPQGVIVNFNEKFYGLAHYDQCLTVLGSNKMYPHTQIELYVHHFDTENLWIIFSTQPC